MMSEIEQLKERINKAAYDGLKTSFIKEDYEPVGQLMISQLVDSGEFVSQRDNRQLPDKPWKVWSKSFAPNW